MDLLARPPLFSPAHPKHLHDLRRRIVVIGSILIVSPMLVIFLAGYLVMQRVEQVVALSSNSAKSSNEDGLSKMALNLMDACRKYHQQSVAALENGQNVLRSMGPVRLDGAHMSVWHAHNELSGEGKSLEIPLMTIGETPLVSAVDDVSKETGAFAAIFQRLNDRGDMLRVASSFNAETGTRETGTFIPAELRAGESAKVLQTVLSGNTYLGKEVLNRTLYLTAYQPLKNSRGFVVGMLNTVLPEEQIQTAVKQLANTSGKTAADQPQMFIFQATGDLHGEALAMADQTLERRNLWNEKDSAGRGYVQEICSRAAKLPAGALAAYTFEKAARVGGIPRTMTARFAYVPELDWAVGFTQPETETQASLSASHFLVWMLWLLFGLGVASTGFALQIWLKFSDDLAAKWSSLLDHLRKDTKQLTEAAVELAQEATQAAAGNRVSVRAADPLVTATSHRAMQHMEASSAWIAEMLDAFEQITGSANYLNLNAAPHSAHSRRAGDPFAEELRALVQRCRQAARTAQSEIRQSQVELEKEHSQLAAPPANETRPELDENSLALRRQADTLLQLAAGIDRSVEVAAEEVSVDQ